MHTKENNTKWLFSATGVKKRYRSNGGDCIVFNGVNFGIVEGAITGIIGRSGSGKSTLMHMLGTTDAPDEGSISFRGTPIDFSDRKETDRLRMFGVAWVFQDCNMIPHLTVAENVMLPLSLRGVRHSLCRLTAMDNLRMAGLDPDVFANRMTNCISGGERQRVAIARALAAGAEVILADEPTGNLDSGARNGILELFARICRENGTTIVLITHERSDAVRICHFIIDVQLLKKYPRIGFWQGGGIPAAKYRELMKARA